MSTSIPQSSTLERPKAQAYVDETSFPPMLRAQMQVDIDPVEDQKRRIREEPFN